MDETETGPELERETTVRLRQKPLISRGLLTALILLGIVALWAGDLPARPDQGASPATR